MDIFNNLSSSLGILSAMLTPAVLISACASLILSTSQRLSRIMDRARRISAQFKELIQTDPDAARMEEGDLLLEQIQRATRRAKLLHRALTSIYLALTAFVTTSVTIGIVAVTSESYAWVAILFGVVGVSLLFYASVLLIDREMAFVLSLAERQAPKELLERQRTRRSRYWPLRTNHG